jgi:leucine dehydrogenase
MMVFDAPDFRGHELVVFGHDRRAGLRGVIALHDTSRGPAVGGCRMWPYASEAAALADVLRLSRGMSYKSALAGLPFGGGKSVIIGDATREKTERLLEAFGAFVDRLGGRYVVAEDVGIGSADVEVMARRTKHVTGMLTGTAASGDPSPHTARGVFVGMRAAVQHRLDRPSLAGLRVVVQGAGAVGSHLCRMIVADGGRVTVADPDASRLDALAEEVGCDILRPGEIYDAEGDILAPCALGGVLNDETIPRLRVGIVTGAANNQLGEERHGDALWERDILYVPDYVVNAGGIINGAGELAGRYDAVKARRDVDAIGSRVLDLLEQARAEGRPPHRVADATAEAMLG